MARMISRNEAAELLDCTPQTVTNWVEKGIIKGHMVDNRLQIDRDSVMQYFDDLKDLEDMEQKISEVKAELQDAIKEQYDCLAEARGDHISPYGFHDIVKRNQLTLISISEDYLTEQERAILTKIVNGWHPEDLTKEFCLKPERILRIALMAAYKLERTSELKDIHAENKSLKEENARLTKENEMLRISVDELSNRGIEPDKARLIVSSIFEKPLTDYNLSTRTLNILKSLDCDTVGDLVRFKWEDMKKALNHSKKIPIELNEFIAGLGLHWDMRPDKMSVEELKAWQR